MSTRRHVLELLALAPAGLALGVSGCAATERPDPAAAWRDPGAGEADPRRFCLAHAILAPNPHNRQPWLVQLQGEDSLVLFVDRSRLLPETDPFNRQIVIGCGAFLELLALAAGSLGLKAEMVLWPEGEPQPRLDERPIAHVRLVNGERHDRDPLFAQITRRHTTRSPYETASLPAASITTILEAAKGPGVVCGAVVDRPRRTALADLGRRAWLIERNNPATHMESVRLTRIGRAEIAAQPDGISLSGPLIEGMSATGLLTRRALSQPHSFASRSGEDMWMKMLQATPAFFWIRSLGPDRQAQIQAGRSYVRAQLAATAIGLHMHPWSQSLQEFPSMKECLEATLKLLGGSSESPVQMLVRLGQARASATPAPRWELDRLFRT